MHTSKAAENVRLEALKDNCDGFRIAEIDADIRGYGDFLGINQSGGGNLNINIDKKLIVESKRIADGLMEEGEIYSEYDEMLTKYLATMKGVSLN